MKAQIKKNRVTKNLFCPNCNEYQDLNATFDRRGNQVGWFCWRTKEMVIRETTVFNGIDMKPLIAKFLDTVVNDEILKWLGQHKVYGLSRKLAYRFKTETEIGKKHNPNFYFIQSIVLEQLEARQKALQEDDKRSVVNDKRGIH